MSLKVVKLIWLALEPSMLVPNINTNFVSMQFVNAFL